MYTGRRSKRDFDDEWMVKTNDFLEFACANSRGHLLVWCPCTTCDNKRRVSKEDMASVQWIYQRLYRVDLPW
jgi:hypothetical protein